MAICVYLRSAAGGETKGSIRYGRVFLCLRRRRNELEAHA